MALLCYNRGCGQRFDPETNSDGKRSALPALPSLHLFHGDALGPEGISGLPASCGCAAPRSGALPGRPARPPPPPRAPGGSAGALAAASESLFLGPPSPLPPCPPLPPVPTPPTRARVSQSRRLANSPGIWNSFIPTPHLRLLAESELTRCYWAHFVIEWVEGRGKEDRSARACVCVSLAQEEDKRTEAGGGELGSGRVILAFKFGLFVLI